MHRRKKIVLYSEPVNKYLEGETFSNGQAFKFDTKDTKFLYRDEYLMALAKDKKILHIGFVDHLPLLDEKISKGNWLHKKLMDISDLCVGIDINKEGIEYLQKHYEYENLYVMDLFQDSVAQEVLDVDFDYIFLPDVLEHIGNPLHFLEVVKEKFQINVKNIIITTPNAFSLNNVLHTFKNYELINTDHRFWFTPYTLSKNLCDAKYKIESFCFLEHGVLSRRKIIRKILLSKFKGLRDTLVIEASLRT